MTKKKIDQLEMFFIKESSKVLDIYEQMRNNDPRNKPLVEEFSSIDEEINMAKICWSMLITYAQEYGYDRFKNVDLDLEKFYMEKIQDV